MTNEFLPSGYQLPAQGGGYLKLKQGDNNIRILSSAIIGYEYWTTENKPVRSKEQFKETPNAKQDKDGRVSIKHFWAFIVADLDESNEIKIMEVTQATIQGAIMSLVNNKKWGDPKGYDLTINRSGEDLSTKYSVIPSPHSELSKEIEKEYKATDIKLEELYTGGNPFGEKKGESNEVSTDDIPFD